MLIDSVIVKLTRVSAGVGPGYSLTIYGHGIVIYEGIDNVKIKGKIEKPISEGKMMALLSEFKNSGFFSLKENYMVTETSGRPYTILSIAMPSSEGQMITKKVTHYNGDKSIPEQLNNLENKLDEIIESEKLIGYPVDQDIIEKKAEPIEKVKLPTPEIKKPIAKTPKEKNYKIIIMCVSIFIVIILVLLAFSFGFIDFSSDKDKLSDESNKPSIAALATADSIISFQNYKAGNSFEKGNTFYVYYEYENITTVGGNSDCDIEININILKDDESILQNSSTKTNIEQYSSYEINTDESWSTGNYVIELKITDNELDTSNTETIEFELTEKKLKTKLYPASEIYGIGDFDIKYIFNLGEKIYLYQEYENFAVNEYGDCDLSFDLVVVTNKSTILLLDDTETNSTNIAHIWWFTTDDVMWPTDEAYYVTVYIEDNISGQTADYTTTFSLI